MGNSLDIPTELAVPEAGGCQAVKLLVRNCSPYEHKTDLSHNSVQWLGFELELRDFPLLVGGFILWHFVGWYEILEECRSIGDREGRQSETVRYGASDVGEEVGKNVAERRCRTFVYHLGRSRRTGGVGLGDDRRGSFIPIVRLTRRS